MQWYLKNLRYKLIKLNCLFMKTKNLFSKCLLLCLFVLANLFWTGFDGTFSDFDDAKHDLGFFRLALSRFIRGFCNKSTATTPSKTAGLSW